VKLSPPPGCCLSRIFPPASSDLGEFGVRMSPLLPGSFQALRHPSQELRSPSTPTMARPHRKLCELVSALFSGGINSFFGLQKFVVQICSAAFSCCNASVELPYCL
jgi:hypothetical protein